MIPNPSSSIPMKPVTHSSLEPVTFFVTPVKPDETEAAGEPAPIEIVVLEEGHHDHSDNSWKKYADPDTTLPYEKCLCRKSPFLAFEGLWRFWTDMKHPEVVEEFGKARSGGYRVEILVNQVVEFFYVLLLRSGQVEYRRYIRDEYLPIDSRTGLTDFDPHWGAEKASKYCGFFAIERITAHAAMVRMPSPIAFPEVHVVGEKEQRGSTPTGMTTQPGEWGDSDWPFGVTYVPLESKRPEAFATAAYSPFHCFDPWWIPGTNVERNVTGRRPGTATTPPTGSFAQPPMSALPWRKHVFPEFPG